jgi:hypothetical protein
MAGNIAFSNYFVSRLSRRLENPLPVTSACFRLVTPQSVENMEISAKIKMVPCDGDGEGVEFIGD